MTVEPSRQFSRDVRRLGSSQIRRRYHRKSLYLLSDLYRATAITWGH